MNPDTPLAEPSLELIEAFLLSLGIGLLMGLERERNPTSRAGLRTFGLATLLGTVCGLLATRTGSPWLLAGGLVVIGMMMIAAYHRQPDANDPGTTSVVALLLAFCFGAMVWYGYRTSAVMLAILSTILLYFKAELQSISKALTRRDITSVLQFCVLSLVVLPILPNRNFGPYDTLNPYQVWWMVVLISGVSLAGYAALRIVGQRHGALLLGILGGLASSTATTLVYSRHASESEKLQPLSLVVILTANLVVLFRLAIVTAILQPAILQHLLPVLGSGALAGLVFVAFDWLHYRHEPDHSATRAAQPDRTGDGTDLRCGLRRRTAALGSAFRQGGQPGALRRRAGLRADRCGCNHTLQPASVRAGKAGGNGCDDGNPACRPGQSQLQVRHRRQRCRPGPRHARTGRFHGVRCRLHRRLADGRLSNCGTTVPCPERFTAPEIPVFLDPQP